MSREIFAKPYFDAYLLTFLNSSIYILQDLISLQISLEDFFCVSDKIEL